MHSVSDLVLGGITAVLGVVGLFVAARSHEEVGYYGGLLFFIFAVGLIFLQIKRGFDRHDAGTHPH